MTRSRRAVAWRVLHDPVRGLPGKLIDIAERVASEGAKDNADFLRRFRLVYRHLVVTVDGAAAELGFGPFGPMPMEMPGMRGPDIPKLLDETDNRLDTL